MTYSQTLHYLYSQLPMFHRIGAAAYKANLDNTIAICNVLGNPQEKFRSIHIAGTNGKGSCSHMIASILQSAGYKTGLYTSPHLKDFRERIKINGKMIPRKKVTAFVKKHHRAFDKIQPSFFEWTVGLAFDHFAKEKVDVAVIETGLGGRLDSTNIITPLVSLITNISFDHTNLLGNTLEKIAFEKAGIIKAGVPVIVAEHQKLVRQVFISRAKRVKAPLHFADHTYRMKSRQVISKGRLLLKSEVRKNKVPVLQNLFCSLPGLYQKKNIPGVLKTIDLLREKGFYISDTHIQTGLESVAEKTGLMGRWQVLQSNPMVIADISHNEAGIREVMKQVKAMRYKKLHIVIGTVNDKNTDAILIQMPKDALYYFCKARIPRAKDALELAAEASLHKLNGSVYKSVNKAFEKACSSAGKKDLVLVTGSAFVVGEMV